MAVWPESYAISRTELTKIRIHGIERILDCVYSDTHTHPTTTTTCMPYAVKCRHVRAWCLSNWSTIREKGKRNAYKGDIRSQDKQVT